MTTAIGIFGSAGALKRRLPFLFFLTWISVASIGWSQTGPTGIPCEQYNNKSQPPPASFNYINILYASADSYVVVSDQAGGQIGTTPSGKLRVGDRRIPHTAFEDDFLAESEAQSIGWTPERKPEMIQIQYPSTGPYTIRLTSRNNNAQSLEILASTCDKRWIKQLTIPAARPGTVQQLRLVYDPSGAREPEVIGPEPAPKR